MHDTLTHYPWSEGYALGNAQMDDTHREFVDLIDALMGASDEEFLGVLDRFVTHTEQHFAQETEWMQAHEFPAVGCHEMEHKQVLASTVAVRERVANGDVAVGRYLVKLLAEWFPQHATSMDRALSDWMRDVRAGITPELSCGGSC